MLRSTVGAATLLALLLRSGGSSNLTNTTTADEYEIISFINETNSTNAPTAAPTGAPRSDALGSVYGDEPFPGTCGGLKYDCGVCREPQARLCSDEKFCLASKLELPSACAEWSEWSCCSRSEALATIAAADVEATELVEAHEKLSVVDETLDGFCFYGYADYTVCPDLLRWMRCAMSCDARIPRDTSTGLPKTRICSERFTPRVGIDTVTYSDEPSNACEQAKSISNMGSCDIIYVVGQGNDFAIAVGDNKAICRQR